MTPSLGGLLARLLEGRVEFVLTGGLAAVAQGTPVVTFDVDIVHRRTDENVERLMTVLGELHAFVREPGARRLGPQRDALMGPGHCLFVTDLGPLDCLGAIEDGLDYGALQPHTRDIELGGQTLHVVTLEKLLDLKERWTDDESKLRAAMIRRALAARANR